MGQLAHEQAVCGRLCSRPHLVPVFTNASMIPQRLREVNPAYYVVLNVVRVLEKIQGLHYKEWTAIPRGVTPRWNAWYEVHKLTAPPWSEEGVVLPFGPLDARAIQYVIDRDTELTGSRVFDRMIAANEAHEAALARKRHKLTDDIARDIRTAATLDYWGRSHY